MAIQDIKLEQLTRLFEIAQDVAHVGYWEWDIQSNDVFWSRQKIEIYGENSEHFRPTFEKFLAVIDSDTRKRVFNEIDEVLNGNKEYYDLEHQVNLKSGKVVWVHEKAFVIYNQEQQPVKMVGIVYDITDKVLTLEKLKITEKQTSYLKTHDLLTGLYNKESLYSYITELEEQSTRFNLMFLDISHFQTLNNTYGHIFGDIILQKIALALKLILKDRELYRYASDEFVIILTDDSKLNALIDKIQKLFKAPLIVQNIKVYINYHIGISSFPNDSNSAYECVKNANLALMLSKNSQKDSLLHYETYMSKEISKRHALADRLHEAIKMDEIIPFYQPKINSATGHVVGFEALVRWHMDGEFVPPNIFLDVAQESGFINDIDLVILKKSLKQLKFWNDSGYDISVSVNFTNGDFDNPDILELLNDYSAYLDRLIIEVTENELINFDPQGLKHLNKLKALGVKLSLDDFGTGYSSLQYIHQLPIDEIKIDKVFVDNIPGLKKNEDLVKIIYSIVDTFQLDCVVEGVETREQLNFFTGLNLNIIQGYFYSRPLDSRAATDFLTARK